MNKVTTILTLMQTQFESPLHDAAKNNDLGALKDICEQNPERINETNENFETPLYLAAANGNEECVEYLISKNCALNTTKKKHLDHDANINATPLFIACRNGHLNTVKLLLAAKAEVGKAIVGGVTPLYIAAENGHTKIVHELLNHGAGVDRAAYNGATPLFVASFKGNLEAVQKLIEYHANVDKSCQGMTPLLAASQEGHTAIVATLLEFDADIDQDSNEGNTSLYAAAQYGHLEVVKTLLKKGANVDAANDNGCTPLFIASVNGNAEIVHELLKANADVDYDNDHGASPLYVAAHNGFIDVMKELLAHDAQVDKMYGDQTPLHVAAENGYSDAIRELIAYEADVDIAMDNGATALFLASDRGYAEIVRELLTAQAAIDVRCDGATPLFVASENGHEEVVKVLLSHKADINCEKSGATPLYVAAQNGHLTVVKELVRWQAELHMAYHGKTPLYIAAQNGHEEIVVTLVEAGSDVSILCQVNDNPYMNESSRRSSTFIRSQQMDVSAIPQDTSMQVDAQGSYVHPNETPVGIPPHQSNPHDAVHNQTAYANADLPSVPARGGTRINPINQPSTTTTMPQQEGTPQEEGSRFVPPQARHEGTEGMGMSCLSAATVWNHPKIVEYLVGKSASILLMNEYGYSLIDMNLNPKVEAQFVHHEAKQEITMNRQFNFVERVAVKTECLSKEGVFAEDIEVLWELFSQLEEQDQMAYHIASADHVKATFQATNADMTSLEVRMEDCEALMAEHSAKQEQIVQLTYIADKQRLHIFYLTFYIRFVQLLVGSLIINERITKYETVKDITINPGKNQHAPKNLKVPAVKLAGEHFKVKPKSDLQNNLTVLLKYITNLEFGQLSANEIHDGQFSLVARTIAKVAMVVERVARSTTVRYEHQIQQLTVPSAILLAEAGIARVSQYLTHNAFGTHATPEVQLHNIMFKFESVHPQPVVTQSKILSGWSTDGIYRCSGVRTTNHSLYRGAPDGNVCHLPEQYGFRLGTSAEVSTLGLQPTNMDVLTQRYENPLFSVLARREKPPSQQEDTRTNALELKVAKLEQLNRVQGNRVRETERLLRQQSELITRLQTQLNMNDARDAQVVERVSALFETMKQIQNTAPTTGNNARSGRNSRAAAAAASSSSNARPTSAASTRSSSSSGRRNTSIFSRFKRKRAPKNVYSVTTPTTVHNPPLRGDRAAPVLPPPSSVVAPSAVARPSPLVVSSSDDPSSSISAGPVLQKNLSKSDILLDDSSDFAAVYDPNDSGVDDSDSSEDLTPDQLAERQREQVLYFRSEAFKQPAYRTNVESKTCVIM